MMNPELPYQRGPTPEMQEARTTLQNALQWSERSEGGHLLLPVKSKHGPNFEKNGAGSAGVDFGTVLFIFILGNHLDLIYNF